LSKLCVTPYDTESSWSFSLKLASDGSIHMNGVKDTLIHPITGFKEIDKGRSQASEWGYEFEAVCTEKINGGAHQQFFSVVLTGLGGLMDRIVLGAEVDCVMGSMFKFSYNFHIEITFFVKILNF
jgi:hypothetical protein